MQARIPPGNRLSRKQKAIIRDYVEDQERDSTRRFLKLMCVVLNDEYGFGASRLSNVIRKLGKLSQMDDEIFWHHVDRKMEQLGIPFDKERDL